MNSIQQQDLVMAISPCGEIEPSPRIAVAARVAGGLGVLDLGKGDEWALRCLDSAISLSAGPIGVRVPTACAASVDEVIRVGGDKIELIVIGQESPWRVSDVSSSFRVFVEVADRAAAHRAVKSGADGLVLRGLEGGGAVSELSSFVLLQQLAADADVRLPLWVAGGIGPHTAAACIIGGAAGVVLDSQLALMPESDLPGDVTAAIRGMDGSETIIVQGRRYLRRGPKRYPGIDPVGEADSGTGESELDPDTLLPVGEDGWQAVEFARRWRDTGGAVHAIRDTILEAVENETAVEVLAPGSPLAEARGIAIPVAQGPMTRVSDQPGFAAQVAAKGALPFIALALANEEQTRRMLSDTAAALPDTPWGVGVLGFAPEEVRSAQLKIIREVRPSCVIVAGGRPSHAKALEEAGIATYLHVPSPGLLRQFLRAGSRRFVFEGAECGGHVGPRTSFSLWEAQLAVLEEFVDDQPDGGGEQLELFFAGGIHDARSAAMVAAMAAPLADRGARIGVLMGTAYLFTEEAVDCGTIMPTFQRYAIGAKSTALLTTAPGHATRCLPSPFVAEFERTRTNLPESGLDRRAIWEQLESLNVGRLRIASKGLRRDGDRMLAVDGPEQEAEGLFMAGQVAVLRDATTTVAALHDEVSCGSAEFQSARRATLRTDLGLRSKPRADPEAAPLDIAIIGMSCIFPNASDLAGYWRTILEGTDQITEIPADRWDINTYYSPKLDPTRPGQVSVGKWGGFLNQTPFDPVAYGIPPKVLNSIDPAQLLSLVTADQALKDAGYEHGRRRADHARTGVVFATAGGSDLGNALVLRTTLPAYIGDLPADLDDQLPTITADTFPGMLGNIISGRISNRLDFGGPNFTVDAACASSLAAVDAACKELALGASDLMLCGGVDFHNGITEYVMFSESHALSSTGRSRTFDSAADGTVLGEGVVCIVLKRLADAERDGDRVYAIIKGVGAASDGKALGLTAPRPEGQRLALERAYAAAGISPRDVGLVEAHGTGTVVGDRTELETLSEAFVNAGSRPGNCVLGSVKSQIGHTKSAAGLAGLVKAALSVYTGVRPPTIHLSSPNAAWQPATSPFVFVAEPSPWVRPAAEIRRDQLPRRSLRPRCHTDTAPRS
jgi:3-oxoacyl-(acyl-carrier-protein) synthase/NAD(P)H-dependent flavin oxidoreductase YrpB (nitropropane dioxygenase family)